MIVNLHNSIPILVGTILLLCSDGALAVRETLAIATAGLYRGGSIPTFTTEITATYTWLPGLYTEPPSERDLREMTKATDDFILTEINTYQHLNDFVIVDVTSSILGLSSEEELAGQHHHLEVTMQLEISYDPNAGFPTASDVRYELDSMDTGSYMFYHLEELDETNPFQNVGDVTIRNYPSMRSDIFVVYEFGGPYTEPSERDLREMMRATGDFVLSELDNNNVHHHGYEFKRVTASSDFYLSAAEPETFEIDVRLEIAYDPSVGGVPRASEVRDLLALMDPSSYIYFAWDKLDRSNPFQDVVSVRIRG